MHENLYARGCISSCLVWCRFSCTAVWFRALHRAPSGSRVRVLSLGFCRPSLCECALRARSMAAVLNRDTVGAKMYELQWTDFRHPSWLNYVYLDLDNHWVRMVGLHVSGTRSDSDWHGWCSGRPGFRSAITVHIHHRGNLGSPKIVHFISRHGLWWSTNYPVTMQYQSYIDRTAARFTHSEDAGSDGSWILVAP